MNYKEKYAMYDKVLAIYAALGQRIELRRVCGSYYTIDVPRVIIKQLCSDHGYSDYYDYLHDNKFVFYDLTEYFAVKILSDFRVQARLIRLADMTILEAVNNPIKTHCTQNGRLSVIFTQEFHDQINHVCHIGGAGVTILLDRYDNANKTILYDVIFPNVGGVGKYKDCVVYFNVEATNE